MRAGVAALRVLERTRDMGESVRPRGWAQFERVYTVVWECRQRLFELCTGLFACERGIVFGGRDRAKAAAFYDDAEWTLSPG